MSDIQSDALKRLVALAHSMENSRSAVVSNLNKKPKEARIALESETRKKDKEPEEATMDKDRLTGELQELQAHLEERRLADESNLPLENRIKELEIILRQRHSDIETKADEIRALQQGNNEASHSLAEALQVNDQLQARFIEQLGVNDELNDFLRETLHENTQLRDQLTEANKRAKTASISAHKARCRAKEAEERAKRALNEVINSRGVLARVFHQRFKTRN